MVYNASLQPFYCHGLREKTFQSDLVLQCII